MIASWTPFLTPMDLHEWWWFTLIPLAALVSLSYKAVRVPAGMSLGSFARSVAVMSIQIVAAIAAIGFGLWAFVEVAVPALTP